MPGGISRIYCSPVNSFHMYDGNDDDSTKDKNTSKRKRESHGSLILSKKQKAEIAATAAAAAAASQSISSSASLQELWKRPEIVSIAVERTSPDLDPESWVGEKCTRCYLGPDGATIIGYVDADVSQYLPPEEPGDEKLWRITHNISPLDQEDLETHELIQAVQLYHVRKLQASAREMEKQAREAKMRSVIEAAEREVKKAAETAEREQRAKKAAKLAKREAELARRRRKFQRLNDKEQLQIRRGGHMHAFARWHVLCSNLNELNDLSDRVKNLKRTKTNLRMRRTLDHIIEAAEEVSNTNVMYDFFYLKDSSSRSPVLAAPTPTTHN